MANILLISDNEAFANDLKEQIASEIKGFDVYFDYDKNLNFDIVIIDEKPTFEEKIRRESIKAPIFILSKEDKKNFSYATIIKKPLKLADFLDTLKSCIHCFENSQSGYLKFNQYELRPNTREIINLRNNEAIKLTEKEVAVIKYLYKAQDRVAAKNELLQEVWGYNPDASTHTIETHIYRLRQKVEHGDEKQQLILTEEGGYKLNL